MNDHPLDHTISEFLHRKGGNSHTHLLHLGDKEVFLSSDNNVMMMYADMLNRRLVLGDPIGDEACSDRALDEFLHRCEKEGIKPVFYQTSKRFGRSCEERGLHLFQWGEEAIVDLKTFHMNGKAWLKLRSRRNKFERAGYRLDVQKPPHSSALLASMKRISDRWLGGRNDKGFSVGRFSIDYANRHMAALLYDAEDNVTAFATVVEYQQNDHRCLAIDLMRHLPQAPHGTMDMLFVSIFLWGQERGFERCSLGVAPLVNNSGHFSLKLASKILSKSYNFAGLREFKNKFQPVWEPKLIATSGRFTFPYELILLGLLIHQRTSSAASDQRLQPESAPTFETS